MYGGLVSVNSSPGWLSSQKAAILAVRYGFVTRRNSYAALSDLLCCRRRTAPRRVHPLTRSRMPPLLAASSPLLAPSPLLAAPSPVVATPLLSLAAPLLLLVVLAASSPTKKPGLPGAGGRASLFYALTLYSRQTVVACRAEVGSPNERQRLLEKATQSASRPH
jgi:hypothetical protein